MAKRGILNAQEKNKEMSQILKINTLFTSKHTVLF